MKLKRLPSLKARRRYVVFKLHCQDRLDFLNIRNAIYSSLESWMGQKMVAMSNVRIVQNLWNPKSMTGFIRCNHLFADDVSMGLALIHQIGDSKIVFQTLGVVGTIKSGRNRLAVLMQREAKA